MKFEKKYIYLVFVVAAILYSYFITSLFSIDNTFVLNQKCEIANDAVNTKIAYPFSHIVVDTNKEITSIILHFANREYRILLPVIAHVLKINSQQLIVFQFYLLPVFIFFICLFFYYNTSNFILSLLFPLTFLNSYLLLCFHQSFPFFDAYALVFLGLLLITKDKYLTFSLFLASFLLDERMLFCGVLVLVLKSYLKNKIITFKSILVYVFEEQKVFIIACIMYLLIRILLIVFFDFYVIPCTYLFFMKDAIINNIRGGFLSFIYTYKVWFIILLWNLYTTIKTEKYEMYIILFLLTLFVLVSCIFVYDFSRIQLYFFPIILLNILILISKLKNKKISLYITLLIILFNLVIPSKIIYGGLRLKTQNIISIWNQ